MKKSFFSRIWLIFVFIAIFIIALFLRLFSLQIVKGEEYADSSMKSLVKTVPLKAKRGDILDRYGRVIVTSTITYNVEISKYSKTDETINETIYNLIRLMEKKDQIYTDNLPVSEYPYEYTKDKNSIKSYLRSLNVKENVTADKLISTLKKRYEISDKIPSSYLRKVISVRSEMELRQFSSNNSYVFAKNVNINVVSVIKEDSTKYPGVNIMTSYERSYPENVGAHFLGRVGPIYKEEYEELKSKGYKYTDVIGKEGIEKVYDLELKGKDGVQKIQQDSNGKIFSYGTLEDAVGGNDVILTIDLKLQKCAEQALDNMIYTLSRTEAPDVTGGAVCVINIHSGEILAMASNPTYSLADFDKDYMKNYSNDKKPFWNRAISGTYAPGSTFKILTSIAALEENVVTPTDRITDKGKYTYYKDYQPVCHVYPGSHGSVNVSDAIKVSCNYFFYDVGRRLGVDKIEEYSRKFGLGELTGIEIPGESSGVAASRKTREKNGGIWYPGDTLQSAIGQSDNLFTPLQLCNYIATVVNGGTRYKTHLLYKIKDQQNGVITEKIPEITEQIEIRPENYKAVMSGMRSVTEDGTASSTFRDFEINVGGKTGTAEVRGSNNALFVAFAPYEEPEIAISVVVEHGAHGNYIAPVAREIFEEYFINSLSEVEDEYGILQVR